MLLWNIHANTSAVYHYPFTLVDDVFVSVFFFFLKIFIHSIRQKQSKNMLMEKQRDRAIMTMTATRKREQNA